MNNRKRVFGLGDITLFTVSGVITLDQLASSAAIGPSALGWWLFTLIFFAVPYACITAELGTTWSEQGGFYVWIREAFGARWAARAIWCYWINLALWIPSVTILAASMMERLFFAGLSLSGQVGIAIALIALISLFSSIRTDVGKWLPNSGATVKIMVMLILGCIGLYLMFAGQSRTEFTLLSMIPSYEGAIAFLPVIVFNFMGLELIAAAGDEIKHPARDIPKAIALSCVLPGGLYIFSTFGILSAIPADEIGINTGILDALAVSVGETKKGPVVIMVGLAIIYTLFTNMVTWTMSANRAIQQASDDEVMPGMFSIVHPRFNTPVRANLITGLTATLVIFIYYLVATSAEQLFWTLIAFSSVIFFLPYLLIFSGFVRLRYLYPTRTRPFRMPGGMIAAWLAAIVCIAFVLQALLLFVYVPGEPLDVSYTAPILLGCTVTLVVGEIIVRYMETRRGQLHEPKHI